MNKLKFGLLLLLTACEVTDKRERKSDEFGFKSRMPPITIEEAHANGFSELDTVAVGDTYRAKVFLANAHKVYNTDSLEPIVNFKFGGFSSYWDGRENGTSAPVSNDTGFVKFVVEDTALLKGQIRRANLYVTVTIPLPEKDTVFALNHELTIIKK